jgi:hypothetical protein
VAVEYLNPEEFHVEMKQHDIWSMIGGAEGLTRMRANTDVLLALAAYAKRWNPEKGDAVAERMVRDAMALRRAVIGIGLGYDLRLWKEARTIVYTRGCGRLLLDATTCTGAVSGKPFRALLELGKRRLGCPFWKYNQIAVRRQTCQWLEAVTLFLRMCREVSQLSDWICLAFC